MLKTKLYFNILCKKLHYVIMDLLGLEPDYIPDVLFS
jgi:hypothetical protein